MKEKVKTWPHSPRASLHEGPQSILWEIVAGNREVQCLTMLETMGNIDYESATIGMVAVAVASANNAAADGLL